MALGSGSTDRCVRGRRVCSCGVAPDTGSPGVGAAADAGATAVLAAPEGSRDGASGTFCDRERASDPSVRVCVDFDEPAYQVFPFGLEPREGATETVNLVDSFVGNSDSKAFDVVLGSGTWSREARHSAAVIDAGESVFGKQITRDVDIVVHDRGISVR